MYDGYAYSSSALTNSSVTADITGPSIAFTANDTGSKELTAVSSATSVIKGGSSKFYFIVSPSTSKQHKLNFTINGLSRSVSKTLAFEAGKVTKFTVPINDLKHPHISDALGIVSTGDATNGKKVLDLGDAVKANSNEQPTATINGQANVPIYILGDDAEGSMILRGSVTDVVNALEAGFYAANWPGERSAMTIANIQAYIEGYKISEYPELLQGLKDATLEMRKNIVSPLLGWLGQSAVDSYAERLWDPGVFGFLSVKNVFQNILTNGIHRDQNLINLTMFIDPQTITFNGVVECGASDAKDHIVILNEEHIYKGIGVDMINRFLNDRTHPMGGKFICDCGILPTYRGLKDIVNGATSANDDVNNNGKTFAENTRHAIYCKLESSMANRSFTLMEGLSVQFGTIFYTIFPNEEKLATLLPNLELEITISTCDHYDRKATYAEKYTEGDNKGKYKYTLENLQTNKNPIVFWGLDAYGPNKSSLSN